MQSCDDILEQAARDGTITEWPRVLETVLQKLDEIVHDFPLPSPELLVSYHNSTQILENSFANSPPYTIQRLAELVLHPRKHYRYLLPYLAALDRVVSVSSPVSDFPLPQAHVPGTGGFLSNGDITNGISERDGLGSDESLGGALLTPIPWLHKHNTVANAALQAQELRSESTETIDGPNGAGRIETVSVTNGFGSPNREQQFPHADPSVEEAEHYAHTLRAEGAVTQGELIRQEQQAGLLRNGAEPAGRGLLLGDGTAAVGRESVAMGMGEKEELPAMPEDTPHARGPDVIGPEDMGPQSTGMVGGTHILDMEAAAGRGRSPPIPAVEDQAESNDSVQDVSKEEAPEAGEDVEEQVQNQIGEATRKMETGPDEDMPDVS